MGGGRAGRCLFVVRRDMVSTDLDLCRLWWSGTRKILYQGVVSSPLSSLPATILESSFGFHQSCSSRQAVLLPPSQRMIRAESLDRMSASSPWSR